MADLRAEARTGPVAGAGSGPGTSSRRASAPAAALLASAFVVATCGLVYELLASTLASYLLGDSVTQFSTVIGSYLFAMGIGSWCSRYVRADELRTFVRIELLIALLGGFSAAGLFLLFPVIDHFRVVLYALVLAIGFFVGLEIPLLMRILKGFDFREVVSTVLTFDYVGALAASLLFPLILMPHLGMIRTGFMFGILNAGVALALLMTLPRGTSLLLEKLASVAVLILLGLGFAGAERMQRWSEVAAYQEPIVYAESSPFQRIVITRNGDDLRLYLNGNLQFSSRDEYRYHEALVHPALARVAGHGPRDVLILGGGDGLAAREVLRHPAVRRVTLVDLDPAMTRLFSRSPMLTALNRGALTDPRVRVINADGFRWTREATGRYDAIVVDLPDPVDFSIGKLYTDTFYRQVRRLLAPGGVAVVQSTSPLVAPTAFWTVATTLEASGLRIRPYHAYVPSFGEWGFILAANGSIPDGAPVPSGRFLTPEIAARLFDFPPDMARRPAPVNRLDNQALVRSFADEWARYEG
jgi:spermidine synthase